MVPLPKIDEIYACLRGSKVFSTLDMRSGYHHVEMTDEARPKTAFTLPANLGKWEFLRCPFGLAQAPAYFQRLINEVLAPFDFAFGYLDDILIYSPDVNTHLQHLELVFQRLREVDLKLKMEKCSFLKKHIQYLGHIVSGEGLKPVPEKLSSIQQMPHPYTPKEVKQFLGLVGYYRKFIPRYADIARPLNALTHKDVEFVWTDLCQRSFDLLKTMVTEEPILVYPDPSKPYILFTDASKYAWSCVLTQEYTHDIKGKTVKVLHPISYQSGLFKGSQLNWACLTKEAYAIYMSIKKLDYYLVDADIILRSDHLPLKKFLNKNTLNSKVNNWAVKISPFRITFEYIKGIKNTLADTMSRLITIDPDSELPPEEQGCEYGYYLFDPLPPIHIEDVCHVDDIPEITITNLDQITSTYFDPKDPGGDIDRLLSLLDGEHYEVISSLQDRDAFCHHILTQLRKATHLIGHPYTIDNDILRRRLTLNGQLYYPIVLPHMLIGHVLELAHNKLGHNGISRTYAMLKRLYFWKGMKVSVTKHVKNCAVCQKHNPQVVPYAKLHFDTATFPMECISMDLTGEFYPPSKLGYKYALTVICMLTGYVFCVPLKSKQTNEVLQAYIDNVYAKFGGSLKILSDNGTEFKNKLFEQIAKELGIKHKIYTAPYCPSSNDRIEGFHNFLKSCVAKHLSPQLEWTSVIPLVCAAYNFLPNEHSKESPLFLMFGRDAVLPLNSLLSPQLCYLGNDLNVLSLEALKNMYLIVTENLCKARTCRDSTLPKHLPHHFTAGDTVLIKNHTAGPFDPCYIGDFCIVSFKGNQVELIPSTGGRSKMEHISNIKYIMLAERYISQLPDYELFGRQTKLCLNPKNIPDLSWKWADMVNMQDIGKVTVSHIFHMDDMFTRDTVEMILVNTNVYTHSTTNLCTTVDVCKTVVSSSVKPCCTI